MLGSHGLLVWNWMETKRCRGPLRYDPSSSAATLTVRWNFLCGHKSIEFESNNIITIGQLKKASLAAFSSPSCFYDKLKIETHW